MAGPPDVDTDTGGRCALLMSRSYDRSNTSLADRLKDAAQLKDEGSARPGSALRDMIANLHAQSAEKDSFWGVGGVKAPGGGGASEPKKRRQQLAPLDDRRLSSFEVHDVNSHLAGSWPHPLQRVNSNVVYPQLNGGWACDECGDDDGDVLWHCFRTGTYDLCDACLKLGRGFPEAGHHEGDHDLDDEPLPDLDAENADARSSRPSSSSTARSAAGVPSLSLGKAEFHGEPDRQAFFEVYRSAPSLRHNVELIGPPGAAAVVEMDAADGTAEDAERRRLTKLFYKIDADHSGVVDQKELWEGLAAEGIRINREAAKTLLASADAAGDGDGKLSLEEFIEVFMNGGHTMSKMVWRDGDLVYASPELTRVTETAIMKRSEVNERVWAYIKAKDLISGFEKRPDDQWIEWDANLLRVFVPPDPAAAEGGGKKKEKKKKGDDKPPGIKRWDLMMTINEFLNRNLSAVYQKPGSKDAEACVLGDEDEGVGEGGENPRERTLIVKSRLKHSPRSAYVADISKSMLVPLPLLIGKVKNQHLDLRNYGIASGQASALAAGLKHVRDLTSVDLSKNKMQDGSLAAIVSALSRKKELVDMALTHNDAGRATARAIESLLGQPAFMVGLATLDLTECKLACGGAKSLAMGLLGNATLSKLTLKRNGVGAVGAAAIGEALASNATVSELDLSWNVIRGRGAIVLAQSLKGNSSLRKLNLSWNCLHDEGGVAFGSMLAVNIGLKSLDLSQNNLEEKAGQMLATSFQTNTTIMDMQLNKNPFGLEGGRALMGALRLLGDQRVLGLAGCVFADASGGKTASLGSNTVMFDATRPAGTYDLDLGNSYDRMVVNELVRVGSASLNHAWQKVKYNGKLYIQCRGSLTDPLPLQDPLPPVTHIGCQFIQPVGPVCTSCGLCMKLLVPVDSEIGKDPPKKKKNKDGSDQEPEPMLWMTKGKVLNHFPDDCSVWELPATGRLELEFSADAIIPVDLTPMSASTFEQLKQLITMGDAVDLDGDGEIDEEDVLADNPEKDNRLIEIIETACTTLCFTTCQAQEVMRMSGLGPPPVWSHNSVGRWVPYTMPVCAALEAGFVALSQLEGLNSPRSPREVAESAAKSAAVKTVIEVGGGNCVDVQRMVQVTIQQAAEGGAANGKGEAVMREASNFLSPRVELLEAMFERLVDSEALPQLTQMLNPEEIKQLRGKLGPLWYFDEKNPGGHFGPLALSDPRHRRVVELLLLVEAKEMKLRQDAGVVALGRQLRFQLNDKWLKPGSMRVVPRRGMMEVNFTTSLLGGVLRTDKSATAAIQVATEDQLLAFRDAVAAIFAEKAGSEDGRMGQIRYAMKGLFFNADQIAGPQGVATSLGLNGARMVDLICVAWGRTVDVASYHGLALGVAKILGEPERLRTHERLGIMFAFDPEHPDGTWKMNLELEEDRRVAEMLVTLAVKEDGENWKDEFWSLAAAPETWGLPATWIEEVPREGMLTLTFVSKEWPDGDITRSELTHRTFAAEAKVLDARK